MIKGMCVLIGLILISAGCGEGNQLNDSNEESGDREEHEDQEEMNVDVQAEEIEGGLEIMITLDNKSDQSKTVTFMSGHQFDLRISRHGEMLYDFAEDMMFTQAIIEETIEPGEALIFSDTWGGYEEDTGEVTIQVKVLAEELEEANATESLTYP
ncbi:BsuPI-related putative proteinase inhibitor [Salisediminibacterium beveridgei]|nr:BsuPI-related putative proteinase inhibitor [Salisediminibacterium beveridgei]